MHSCSISKNLKVVPGNLNDYKQLTCFHYCNSVLGPFEKIFALKPTKSFSPCSDPKTIGVIVYTLPSPALELRNIATGNFLDGLDRTTQLAFVNKNIRTIGRVIIEPRFRGMGLSARLVSETLNAMNVPVIEAMAIMGLVNPFFEKAGMTAYKAKNHPRCTQLTEAFSIIGIEKDRLIDPEHVHKKLKALPLIESQFIELEIKKFLQSYGKRRNMSPSLERTKYILSKLTHRPIYYIWFNKNLEPKI